MILLNSFAFELLMLCLFYSAPDEREEGDPLVTINIVGVIVASAYASIITVPVMVSFAWLFDPIIFVRVAIWVLRVGIPWCVRAFFLWPCWLGHCCHSACKRRNTRAAISNSHLRPPPRSSSPPPSPPAPNVVQPVAQAAGTDPTTKPVRTPHLASTKDKHQSITERHLGHLLGNQDRTGEPQDFISKRERNFSYESLDSVLLAASLTRSWSRRDWHAVRKILFGWTTNIALFYGMLFGFLLYGCELFEPREQSATTKLTAGGRRRPGASGGSGRGGSSDFLTDATVVNATTTTLEVRGGSTTDFLYAWTFSALQRFVLHEPTLILAAKGLPILFASAFCTNCVGETIVNLLTLTFETLLTCITELTKA